MARQITNEPQDGIFLAVQMPNGAASLVGGVLFDDRADFDAWLSEQPSYVLMGLAMHPYAFCQAKGVFRDADESIDFGEHAQLDWKLDAEEFVGAVLGSLLA